MKRNTKPFAVEIKKSRVQGHYLPPRRLFEVAPAPATKSFQKEEPEAIVEPSPTPRILPSIVEPVWSSSVPVEPVQRQRSSGKASPEQMEFNLAATAAEDVLGAHAEAPMIATIVLQTEVDPVVTEDTTLVHNAQPAQRESVEVSSRKARKKASQAGEAITAFRPAPIQVAEVTGPSVVTSSKAGERRQTKRLAATVQLPRYERWKRRLHPASW
jgi:hypothetical protein